MSGKEMVEALMAGAPLPRPPYVPLLGRIALALGQVSEEAFRTDPQVQARALLETATSLGADLITVGQSTDPSLGTEVVRRLQPVLAGRGVAACLPAADVAAARAYCEAGVDMVLLISPDRSSAGRFRTLANACSFYGAPAILVDPSLENAAAAAADLKLHGAVVADPTGEESGIIGGGLSPESFSGQSLSPPRSQAFFWSFPGEVPAEASPEDLAGLGRRITG